MGTNGVVADNTCVYSACSVAATLLFFFFFNDPATTGIYTLSLHDALPICPPCPPCPAWTVLRETATARTDRKSTRLNSSHPSISYAVFCLKKKNSSSLVRSFAG